MSHALKNNLTWQPSASITTLQQRAQIFKKIRDFFTKRQVLEVDTPLVCHTSVTDPFIESIPVLLQLQQQELRYYLQTSPEYAMKRLLAAGSGAIYQISKAFRQGEIGRLHNPEFTLLEWYRPGFDHHTLMNEVDELLQFTLQTPSAEKKSYADVFQDFLQINPHTATLKELAACAKRHISIQNAISERDTWLNLLLSHCIEPKLGQDKPCFIYDFPASQAALARIQSGNPPLAARFEVYIQGIELANGFHELQDADEQRQRFIENLLKRQQLGLVELPLDEYFLAALAQGLPDCAGVALGVDRLVMLATQADHIDDVLSFTITRV